MLHFINSNYQGYQSLSQNKNLAQNANLNESNSAQNVNSTSPKQSTGLSKENSTQNTSLAITQGNATTNSSNLVLDKSQAVSKVFGYGVDSEGYFTSDFNEATGLPKDYKINAKEFENLLSLTQSNSINNLAFTDIDLTKSLGNVYKLFSQLNPSDDKYLSKDE